MKNAVLLFVAGFMAALSAQAQDIIITKKSDRIEAKIVEVTENEVKFKSASNPEGGTITLPTSKIASITYANGNFRSYDQVQDRSAESTTKTSPQKTYTGRGFELGINAMVASTLGTDRKEEACLNLGIGYRFSKNFYWGVNVGVSHFMILTRSRQGSGSNATWVSGLSYLDAVEIGTTLRPTLPLSNGKACLFVDLYAGYVIGEESTALHILPGFMFPLSSHTDFLISAGYMNTIKHVYGVPSFGVKASFVFHGNKLPKVKKPKVSWE